MNAIRLRQYFFPFFAFLAGGALLLMLHTRGHVVEPVFLRYLLVWAPVALFLAAAARKEFSAAAPDFARPGAILLIFMVLYLFSSSADYPWFYFLSWLPRNTFGFHLLESQLGRFVLLTALMAPFLMARGRWIKFALPVILLYAVFSSAHAFIRETGGAFLYRDDHPSFLFRLHEFCAAFPSPVNYNPFWNGGLVSNHPVLTGTPAFGVFFLPFYGWLPIEQCYTPLIAVVFIGLVPLMALFSMRLIGASWPAAFIAGILALGTSQFYFLWLLFYGTVGAVFSAACLMPVSAVLFRALFLNKREKWAGVILVSGACFLLMWPPNALLAAVLLFVLLLNFRRLSRPNVFFLLVCGAIIILLQWPQIFEISKELLQGYYAGAPVVSEKVRLSGLFFNGYGKLVDYIRMAHPLLIFLGLGGAIAAVGVNCRRWFLPLILFLLLLTGWGPELAPQFQLFRMMIPLSFAAVFPAALAADGILRAPGARFALFRAAVIAVLVGGAVNTVLLFGNHARAPYQTMSSDGYAFADWIRANAPEGTRVLFAGSTVHGYDGGHVAFLPCLTGREMMACDYYHFSPTAVEYDYPPRPWRDNAELFNRFLEFYNISVITTLRDNWKEYLRSRPDEYREGQSFGEGKPLAFFRVARPALSQFLEGAGRVKASFNRLEVDLNGTNERAVIKYNWQPGLFADKPAEIFPCPAGPGIRLIGILPHGRTNIVIRYKSWP
ncbi:MAG: hypothetical protein PHP98_05135 [Kiritimatiellae bacterium]|nr:hypothetical protein [Kiritimatiellia bacterium]